MVIQPRLYCSRDASTKESKIKILSFSWRERDTGAVCVNVRAGMEKSDARAPRSLSLSVRVMRGAGAAGPRNARPAATAAALSPAGGEDIVCDGGVCMYTRRAVVERESERE